MKANTKANKLNILSILALLWLGSFGVFGQAAQEPDWKWQNPLPTGNTLNDVFFLNDQIGWAVGQFGTILKTSNGGQTWQSQSSGTPSSFTSVQFTDTQTGWVVGSGGTIVKTTNGGQNWQSQISGTTSWLSSVHFINSQSGSAVGFNGIILKTANGGESWQRQSSGTANSLYSAQFIDFQTGWAVGEAGTILKTTNGGQIWQSQSTGTTTVLNSVHFTNSQIGYAVGFGGTIIKTTNGGQSWQSQISGTASSLFSVQFTDNQTGWVVGSDGTILNTTNGGQSWQILNIGIAFGLSSIHFSDAQTGIVVGSIGTILKTTNSGQSWQPQGRGMKNVFSSVYFTDFQTGWAVGEAGTILKTTNGGQIWQSQSSGTIVPLYSVHFTNSQIGYAVGFGGTIIKTTNGGQSWQSQSSGTTINLRSVRFSNSLNGCAVGDNRTILRTTNGGQSWQSQSLGTTDGLFSVHFTDSQTGWAVGSSGLILKTNDGGQNWNGQYTGIIGQLTCVYFKDPQNGWAVGGNSSINMLIILKTTNGGQNWQSQSIFSLDLLYSVHFTDSQNGLAVGGRGTILKTSNGGNSWQGQVISGTQSRLNSVYFTDPLHGWIVGENGTILTKITNNPIDPETPTNLITGTLFEKTTANCTSSNIQVTNQLIKAEPGPYYGISNNQGKYNLRLPLADTATSFTLQALENQNPAFSIEVVCPPNNQYNITLDTIPDTLSNKDFGFEITPCHHLDLQLASNRRRRCFQNTTSISYYNQGSLPAPDAYLLVEYPHWVRPVSASRNYVALNDSVWRFNLDTVSAGEFGAFTITDSVLCGNVNILGLSQCTKATIYPALDCPPSAGWNGSEISVSGKCNKGAVKLGIYNRTAINMTDSVEYWVYMDSIQVRTGKVKLAAGDSLNLQVFPRGLGVYLSVNQVANHPRQVFVSTAVDGCDFFPLARLNAVSTHLPVAQSPSSKTHCLEIRGSYDPNDKQAFPIGFTNQNIIAPNTRLEFLVRFQNTGNDTAFTVYVIDTLDTNLNPETIELGAASHNYQLSMQTVKSGKTFLRWQFNNIQLPDSTTNNLKSNGFIQYRISPKANLALGTQVRNHAEIYFDFNPPIITNQTLTTYNVITFKDSSLNGNVQIVTATKGKLSPKQIGVNLYPNPVLDHSLTADFNTKGSLSLFNAQGQLVFEKQNIEGKQVLPIQLRTGFYMAQLRTEKGVSVVKVVVE